MSGERRVPFGSLTDERLHAAFERNLSHTRRGGRPDQVDADIWERYEYGRPWVLLNVGLMGLQLGKPETTDVLREASRAFYQQNSNFWLVAEILSSRGRLEQETAFGLDPFWIVEQTVRSAIAKKAGLTPATRDGEFPQLGSDAVSLLLCAVARNQRSLGSWFVGIDHEDQKDFESLIMGVRSTDHRVDRRLGNLRAISTRSLHNKSNIASLRSLIWGAVSASTVTAGERDKGFALMGVEPILDPVTLATCMLIFEQGGLRDRALPDFERSGGGVPERPRGWDDDVDLASGQVAFLNYVRVLGGMPYR